MLAKIGLFSLFVVSLFLCAGELCGASAQAGDAIAVRVLPNPNHYSPATWYAKQGFKGSPVPIKVDGYEAIRDGRTVYVNVANVAGSSLYTNIYLISYNQEATPETLAIFEKILAKWRFNDNLTVPGTCQSQDKADACLADADCTGGGYCSSEKARLVRDIKRLGDIVDLREKVEQYGNKYGKYPVLSAGTYLPGKSVSTWPSWNTELANALGGSVPSDPINKLGKCDQNDDTNKNYDPKTCWNDSTKSFADADRADPTLNLPANSHALVYTSENEGQNYEACAYMESGYLVDGSLGACDGSYNSNQPPTIDCGTLMAIAGQPFDGYIGARDVDDDKVRLEIYSYPASGFSVVNTDNSAKVRIYSSATPAGEFTIRASSSDAHSNTVFKDCSLKAQTEAFIVYPIADQRTVVGNNKQLNFSVYANHSEGDYAGLQFHFNDPRLDCNSPGPQRLQDGRYECRVSFNADVETILPANVYATNNPGGDTSTKQFFNINVYNNKPVMNPINCDPMVRVSRYPSQENDPPYHYNYSCEFSATDPDGHKIKSYILTNGSTLPPNMTLQTLTKPDGSVYGLISGFPLKTSTAGNYKMFIAPIDEFNSAGKFATLPLKIVDFCGDEVKQIPNMEGKGGQANDGYEDCDDHDGAPWPQESNVSWQYGCNSSTCASLQDGYCGDEKVQDGLFSSFLPQGVETIGGRKIMHTKNNYGEQCDDGNQVNGDGCNTFDNGAPSCNWECGDGTVTHSYHRYDQAASAPNITEECDFGANADGSTKNNNCCNSCLWVRTGYTDSPTAPTSGTIPAGDRLSVAIPNNRGVKSLVFNANPSIILNSFINSSGIAIMLVSDISGLPTAQTLGNIQTAAKSAVNDFYTWGTTNGVNLMMGEFGFGNCPAENYFCYRADPSNLKGSVSNRDNLISKINSYTPVGDLSSARSALDLAIPEAHRLLNLQPASYMKYMIILTDGCTCTYNAQTEAAAAAAKASGIKIYTVSYWDQAAAKAMLCRSSSDGGSNCYTGRYSHFSDAQGTQIQSIINNIIEEILDSIPQNFYVRIENSSGQFVDSSALAGDVSDFRIDIPDNLMNCDISGADCSGKSLYIKPSYDGRGSVSVDNIRANILPPCNP